MNEYILNFLYQDLSLLNGRCLCF